MNDTTPYKKVLLHVGTNEVLKDDHQTVISETKNLIDLIQTKWPAEVTVSAIILHKTDSRKNIKINKINDEIKQKAHEWYVKFLDNTNVVTLATGHIDPEAYFDSLHLNNEKGTKKLANNIKFALGLKLRTYTNERGDRSHTKQTDNISKPHLFTQNTTRPTERVSYAQKLKYSAPPQQQKAQTQPLETQSLQPQKPMQLSTTDLNPVIYALKTLQHLLQILQ